MANVLAQEGPPLEGTARLTVEGDLSAQMVEGIDRWLMRETERVAKVRKLDVSTPEAVARARLRLRERLGMKDETVGGAAYVLQSLGEEPIQSPDGKWTVTRVGWPVFDDMPGHGLLLKPVGESKAFVIVLSDSSEAPEDAAGFGPAMTNFAARRLVEQGCTVLVPLLIDRGVLSSGNQRLNRMTNLPHREWIYRPAFEVGRTVIGYEVEKVIRALDAFPHEGPRGIFGFGEGGWIALHAAALDDRFKSVAISGCFGPCESMWEGFIYRNVFGWLRDFGTAELAAMIAPRKMVVEYSGTSFGITSIGPRSSARPAPGISRSPDPKEIAREIERANRLRPDLKGAIIDYQSPEPAPPMEPGQAGTLRPFLRGLGMEADTLKNGEPKSWRLKFEWEEQRARQGRAVADMQEHTQRILRECESVRNQLPLWTKLKPGPEYEEVREAARAEFWEKVMGKLPTDYLPANPRTRQIYDKEKWRGYDVMLDVHPDISAWGILLLPKDLKPGERRPVVVCQHGLEGLPEDTINEDPKSPAYGPYKAFAARLVERGFIVYAPHNPYRGGDKFRVLQRKANPLGLSLFSFIIAQHDVTTKWLASLPFVDPERIGFYGLSYGGKTAMRVPAVLDRYCLSICSADFNEWVLKNASTEHAFSYVFTNEYEIFEWDLGHTFNYAEMALLIAPRPFMVERGHDDGVGTSEHVGYEFGKVRRGYDKLGIPERAEIEWFNGPHTIHGVGTFKFLHRWLKWPEPK